MKKDGDKGREEQPQPKPSLIDRLVISSFLLSGLNVLKDWWPDIRSFIETLLNLIGC